MEKNIKTEQYKPLVNKLEYVVKIFEEASKAVHNEPMTKFLLVKAEQHKTFMFKLENYFQHKVEELSIIDRLKFQFEKIGFELNDMFINRNEKEVLQICLNNEEKLITEYHKVLDFEYLNENEKLMLITQLEIVQENKRDLETLCEKYDFLAIQQ